jgi:methyl acetate hydrolase
LSYIRSSQLDAALRHAVEERRVPGIAAVVTNAHETLYEGAAGYARVASKMPMRVDTVCRIASMTKLVTSIAVLMLRDEGKLELDAPFSRYFSGYRQPPVLESFDFATREFKTRPARSAVTVRQLLTHTAGYGYWFLDPELRALHTGTPEHFNPPFLMHEPGSDFRYGISTDVLGQCVEPLTGLRIDRFFEERIFGPLGMADCSFDLPADSSRLAAVHVRADGELVEQPIEPRGETPRGGGGLYTTARDYAALLRPLLRGGAPLLGPESARDLVTHQLGARFARRQRSADARRTADFGFMDGTQHFGLGVLIETRDRATGRHAGSYGWAGIFNTYYWVDPVAQLAAVVFMQMSPFAAPDCLAACEVFERELFASARL